MIDKGGRKSDKDDLDKAYAGINDGVSGIFSGIAIFGRYLWNAQIRFLKSIGIMHIFVSHWWLFLIVGFVLLAFVMPVGLVFLGSALAAIQMNPDSKDDYIVPLSHDNRKYEDLREIAARQEGKLKEYADKMGAFKDATLSWVIEEHGPLHGLKSDFSPLLFMYLTEASAAACKQIDIDERLHDITHEILLGKLGFPPGFAEGMVHATMTNPFGEDGAAGGEIAYIEWCKDGTKAAISNIENAFFHWERAKNITDELGVFDAK